MKRTLHRPTNHATARTPHPARPLGKEGSAVSHGRLSGKKCAATGLAVCLMLGTTALSAGAVDQAVATTVAPLGGALNSRHSSAPTSAKTSMGAASSEAFLETEATTVAVPSEARVSAAYPNVPSLTRSLPSVATATLRARPSYPWPSGAMAVTLYKDGRHILAGEVADIDGTVYVPVQRFVNQFGSFGGIYEEAIERVTYTGKNLKVVIRVGDPYITVNDRIFYTGRPVLSLGGWIFAPLEAMTMAMGSTVTVKKGWYQASIVTGDPTSVAWASDVYDEEDLYWLSRIISAEARGESLTGRIAVGNVVLNRTLSPAFPNSVKGVVFDKKYGVQFSPVSNGTIYNAPTVGATIAAKICLEGYSLSSRVLYFFNPAVSPSNWISTNRPYIFTIGNHKFYG